MIQQIKKKHNKKFYKIWLFFFFGNRFLFRQLIFCFIFQMDFWCWGLIQMASNEVIWSLVMIRGHSLSNLSFTGRAWLTLFKFFFKRGKLNYLFLIWKELWDDYYISLWFTRRLVTYPPERNTPPATQPTIGMISGEVFKCLKKVFISIFFCFICFWIFFLNFFFCI